MQRRISAGLAVFLLLWALASCAKPPRNEETTAPETNPVSAAAETETSQPEPEPETTEPPTESPTEPTLVLHSGLREDGSFDEGTWFIGDSMTCILVSDYLEPNNLIGDANYTGKYGARIVTFFDETVVMSRNTRPLCKFRPEHEGMSYTQVGEELGEQVTAIYMMFGTNHTIDAGAEAYIHIVDYLLETCPNATIHMQLIPWGYFVMIKYDQVNGWIREAYAHYQQMGEERVMVNDTFSAIGRNTDQGYIHLNYQGNENWYHAIVAHAEENNLVQ